jgi:hypothetical protein
VDSTTVARFLEGLFSYRNHPGAPRQTLNIQDRVLATCDEHGLDYAIDETNFQPEVTLRNAIRHALSRSNVSDVSNRPAPSLFSIPIKTRASIAMELLKKSSQMLSALACRCRSQMRSSPCGS